MLSAGLAQGSTIIVQRVEAQHEDPAILLLRNYLSIGALKRQMVTVQKNEEAPQAPQVGKTWNGGHDKSGVHKVSSALKYQRKWTM